MRIGVLTFHRCINYGSYWQARCLVEGLRAQGHEAVLLDHDSAGVRRAELRCALSPTLPRRTRRADLPRYAAKVRRFERDFERLPCSRRFPLDAPEAAEEQDMEAATAAARTVARELETLSLESLRSWEQRYGYLIRGRFR